MAGMLDGKVAVVTGAGRGIGRATAICLAANGAKVVVCDVGAAVTGEGHDVGPAEQVVAEITQANGAGRAVANTDSVAEWENAQKIVQTAIDNFGRIDMVVNNAGILRDRIFHYMTPEEWDAVIKVHLYGAFYVSRAAVPHFRKQESGCYVHITSTSGLIGSVGQVNYGAAKLGIVDRIFTRVGASDDLSRGQSTFMVEMNETANILNNATERSLIILDEVGRGTSTFDGLSIAWSIAEFLHDRTKARTLFATHYHELTALAAKLPDLACHTMRVKEWKGEVVFLYEVGPGTADRSYGIHVGKLAGLPKTVTARAEEVLGVLEKGEQGGALARLADDLPLFNAARRHAEPAPRESAAEALLHDIRPDELSPREALDLVYRLKGLPVE